MPTPTTGAAASNSGSVGSLALPAFDLTVNQTVVVVVALGSTSSNVTSITDSAGNAYSLKKVQNGTGVRIEEWQAQDVAARASNVITVNVSPNTSIAAAAEEYASSATLYANMLSRAGWSATASGSFGGFPPSNALDGAISTAWASDNTALPHWIAIDMGSAQSFNFITIIDRQDYNFQNPTTIELYVSDDGSTWGSAVETWTGLSTALGATVELVCSTTYTHRYFKLNVTAVYNTNISTIAEIYAGITTGSAPTQNTGSASGSNQYPYQGVALQDGGGLNVTGVAFACQSGDTLTAQLGTSRQSSIPAATAVGVALYDNTATGSCTVNIETLISAARQWATAALELRVISGVAVPYEDYTGKLPPANETNVPTPALMPTGGGGGVLPPAGDGQIFPPPVRQGGS